MFKFLSTWYAELRNTILLSKLSNNSYYKLLSTWYAKLKILILALNLALSKKTFY
jgi:hypothetical protein